MSDRFIGMYAILGSIFWLLGAILILLSINKVNFGTYAIDCNNVTQRCNETPYEPGHYFTGIFHTFHPFSNAYVTVEFDQTWIKPLYSQTCQLSVSCQIKLHKDQVHELFRSVGDDPEALMRAQLRSAIYKSSLNYELEQFWEDRNTVAAGMMQVMQDSLVVSLTDPSATPIGDIEYLQLKTLYVADLIEQQVTDLQVAVVGRDIAQTQGDIDLVEAETDLLTAENDSDILIIDSYASRNITIIQGQGYNETSHLQASTKSSVLDTYDTALGGADYASTAYRLIHLSEGDIDIAAVMIDLS
eukprot:gnl/Dysnectes_brevis/1724_a1960_2326.p1 GENE.gnl/Dysnectes_brevis/1724_a1960_2326~~gnl/Dysnectes_brevis/1724_a1960_2326.p1  ORF type:complete len:301 (-),score=66.63 gnl/Dysnectes_brevis/1724_a1960_2326:48-950(-)